MTTPPMVVHAPGRDQLQIEVPLPVGWQVAPEDAPGRAVAAMPPENSGPFVDNLIATIQTLPASIEPNLDAVRSVSLIQMHATVPDLQMLDDRPIELDDRTAWFRASLATGPENLTITTREVFTLDGRELITLVLTSLPFRDADAADAFARITSGCRIIENDGAEQ